MDDDLGTDGSLPGLQRRAAKSTKPRRHSCAATLKRIAKQIAAQA